MTPKTPLEIREAVVAFLDWSGDPRCHPQQEPLFRALADALLWALGDPKSICGVLLDGARRDLKPAPPTPVMKAKR